MYPSTKIQTLLCAAGLALAGCGGGGGSGGNNGSNPLPVAGDLVTEAERALSTDQAALDAALHCSGFDNPDKPPVLMVHGTFVTGAEEYTFFYTPMLLERGYDVCIVTYPDRGLGDMQVSAEYVVNALRRMRQASGRKVAMIGHSQGGLMPRWAIRYFPSARNALQEFVNIAGPNHGTTVALPAALAEQLLALLNLTQLPVGLVPEALLQTPPDANFVQALNRDDETPGDIEYTALYTQFDELVQPVAPEPTAALDFGQDNPKVSNILLQDVCPGHLADHLSIGSSDTLAFALALDAISNPGPADFERAGGAELCALLPFDPGNFVMPEAASQLLAVVTDSLERSPPDPHLTNEEPALEEYAR